MKKINGEGSLTLVLFKELRNILRESLTKDINDNIRETEKEQDLTPSEYKKRIKELKGYLPNSRTYNFPIIFRGYDLGSILLDKQSKTFSISIDENNHIVDDAERTYVYSSFLNFLNNLPKNRKSVKAKLYYESEYNEYGGNFTYYGHNSSKY